MKEGLMRTQIPKREHTLHDLLAGITPANRHAEVNWGAPQGKEGWLIEEEAPLEAGASKQGPL